MGQYVARIFDEVRQRPLYLIAQRLGFDAGRAEGGTTQEEAARAQERGIMAPGNEDDG